jgi:tetratricopeptide (TPR) repeat protein
MSDGAQLPAGAETSEQTLARARAAAQAKRWNEAIGICDDLLLASPELPAALALLGTVRAQRGEVEEAIGLLERAVAKDPAVAGWHANVCALYRLVTRCEDAVRAGREAVRLNGTNPQYLLNLALALVDVDERDQSIVYLLRAIGHSPGDAAAHLALGQILLARGEFAAGWIEYEWRNETEAAKGTLPRMTSAAWNGMRLPGRILLVGDQGYGDTIQFARYIPMVAERCNEVIIGCSPELAPLLAPVPGVTSCLFRWDEIPGHAAHVRLSSLPYLFQTAPSTIPSAPAYLSAPAGRSEAWAARLQQSLGSARPRVGVAWTGRPTHPNDRRRSLRLSRLRPLFEVQGASFVSLQKPLPAADALDPAVLDLADEMTDFGETAAIIENLDLVITIDTAIGHLAGALGKAVWVMLPTPADWRWMVEGDGTAWYPSMRLFRQPAPGAWGDVVANVADALRHFVATASTEAAHPAAAVA